MHALTIARVCTECGEVLDPSLSLCPFDDSRLVEWESLAGGTGADGTDADETVATPFVGRRLCGRYQLVEQLGIGGFGIVFAARDLRLDKAVAVKMLSPSLSWAKDSVARFRQEALAASRIRHEGVVDITDFGVDEGTHFLVMELLAGQDLARLLEQTGALPIERAVNIALQAASALAAAHRADILHRDLKPANIYVTRNSAGRDQIKIIDFGIARAMADARGRLTSNAALLGTPLYMAPEQLQGSDASVQSEVYALGTVLYQMITGQVPFECQSWMRALREKIATPVPSPKSIRASLPAELDGIICRCLEIAPEGRFRSADELVDALERVARAPAESGAEPGDATLVARTTELLMGSLAVEPPRARDRRALRWLGTAGLAGFGLVALFLATRERAPAAAPTAPVANPAALTRTVAHAVPSDPTAAPVSGQASDLAVLPSPPPARVPPVASPEAPADNPPPRKEKPRRKAAMEPPAPVPAPAEEVPGPEDFARRWKQVALELDALKTEQPESPELAGLAAGYRDVPFAAMRREADRQRGYVELGRVLARIRAARATRAD